MDDSFDRSRAAALDMTLEEFRAYRAELLAAKANRPAPARAPRRPASNATRSGSLRHPWAVIDEA